MFGGGSGGSSGVSLLFLWRCVCCWHFFPCYGRIHPLKEFDVLCFETDASGSI